MACSRVPELFTVAVIKQMYWASVMPFSGSAWSKAIGSLINTCNGIQRTVSKRSRCIIRQKIGLVDNGQFLPSWLTLLIHTHFQRHISTPLGGMVWALTVSAPTCCFNKAQISEPSQGQMSGVLLLSSGTPPPRQLCSCVWGIRVHSCLIGKGYLAFVLCVSDGNDFLSICSRCRSLLTEASQGWKV